MSLPRASLLALAVCALSCGGGQTQGNAFNADADAGALADVHARLANVPIPRGADVAVGTFGRRSLTGVPLAGGEPWTFEHPVACRPIIAGSVVVGLGDSELFGLEALTGKKLWTRKAAGCPRGAADDGKITVVSLQPITGQGGVVLAIDREGQVIRQIEDPATIGAPGVVDGLLFLPWDSRHVSAYDLSSGEEIARADLPGPVTRVLTSGGALFFGERAFTRFDERIGLASQGGAPAVALPARDLPDSPVWMTSGNESLPPKALESERARLYARPDAAGAPGITGGRYAATYDRIALGLDATDGAIVWAQAGGARYLGGAAYDGGFALCDADGKVTFLDARTGAEAGSASLEVPVDACVVQADGLTNKNPRTRPLRDQIADALRLRHDDAAPMQRYLLRELTASRDELATDTLLDLLTTGAAPPDLVPDVRAALGSRELGAERLLAELSKRDDFLEGTRASVALGPVADALAGMKDTRAAPLLAAHLLDPTTPPADVQRVAAALDVLAGQGERPAARAFFAMVRSEASETSIVYAAASIASALDRLGDREIVDAARTDPFTSDAVKAKLAAGPAGP